MATSEPYDRLARRLSSSGFVARGGFHPLPADGVPPLADGEPVRTVVMVGHVGRSLWPAFVAWYRRSRVPDHPLDTWSRAVLTEVADELRAGLVMPSDGPPYAPFQQWAMRSEPVHPSPLGLLIHPEYGLSHGWRGALLLAERWVLPPSSPKPWGEAPSPCETCDGRPCLRACPVSAFGPRGPDGPNGPVDYDVPACRTHLRSADGDPCMAGGCRARVACPVGADHAYEPAQIRFHMEAFRDGGM